MAKLSSVEAVNEGLVRYSGNLYEKIGGDFEDAKAGDLIYHDTDDYTFAPRGYYEVIVNGSPDVPRFRDNDGTALKVDRDCVVYRRTGAQTLSIRDRIAALEQELEILRAQNAPSVGNYVRAVGDGGIYIVEEDDGTQRPYMCRHPFIEGGFVWFRKDGVEKLTPAEAKAALLAQVEALFEGAA